MELLSLPRCLPYLLEYRFVDNLSGAQNDKIFNDKIMIIRIVQALYNICSRIKIPKD